MRIDSIRLKNFRGFKSLELLLKPGINVIIGGNGAGKTSIIDALTLGLRRVSMTLRQS